MGTAMTVRIAEGLKNEARDYGKREGLTINALIVVALREYLERRRAAGGPEGPARVPTVTTRAEGAEAPPVDLAAAIAKRVQGGERWGGGRKVKKTRRR